MLHKTTKGIKQLHDNQFIRSPLTTSNQWSAPAHPHIHPIATPAPPVPCPHSCRGVHVPIGGPGSPPLRGTARTCFVSRTASAASASRTPLPHAPRVPS